MLTTRTYFLLVVVSTWAGLHAVALTLLLYSQLWWLHIPMYLIAGVVLALTWFALYDTFRRPRWMRITYGQVFSFVLVVLLLWQLLGSEVSRSLPIVNSWASVIDCITGMFGAYVGYSLGLRLGAL